MSDTRSPRDRVSQRAARGCLTPFRSSARAAPRTGVRHSRVRFGHGDPCRHLGLVVSDLAARVLPRGHAAVGVPLVLRPALRHGRAERDRLPAPERGSVPPLGRSRARRLSLRREAPADATRPRRPVPRTRARARRPARARADRLRGGPRRRAHLLRRGLGATRASSSHGICATSRGRATKGSSA